MTSFPIHARHNQLDDLAGPAVESRAPSERIDALLVATILFMLVSVVSINELLPFLMPLRLALVTFVLAALLYVGNAVGRRSVQRLMKERPVRLMLALFVWMIVTVPISAAPGGAFHFIFEKFFTILILYLLLVAVARGTKDFERLALWYFLGTVFYATHAMRHLGEMMGDSWRMAHVSGLYDANDFAVLCVTGLPLAIHFVRQKGPIVIRLASMWGLVVLTKGIVLSGSRGGLIATVATALFILFRTNAIKASWRIAGLVGMIAVFGVTASDAYWDQMASIIHPEDDYNVTDVFGRKALWRRGIGYAFQFPIGGVGASNFPFAEGTISKEVRALQEAGEGTPWSVPHNTYVQVVSELGFIGFGIFAAFLISAWRSMTRGVRDAPDPKLQSLAQATKASMLGMLVGVFFLSFAYSALFYSILALATVAGRTMSNPDGGAQVPLTPARSRAMRLSRQ